MRAEPETTVPRWKRAVLPLVAVAAIATASYLAKPDATRDPRLTGPRPAPGRTGSIPALPTTASGFESIRASDGTTGGIARERSPEALYRAYCGACHPLDATEALRLDRAGWERLYGEMITKHRADPLPAAEREKVLGYLTEHFGPVGPPSATH